MVIFYDLDTKEIKYTERDVMTPTLPIGDVQFQIQKLKEQNIGFISVPYELDLEVFNYKVDLNNKKEFIGLKPTIE